MKIAIIGGIGSGKSTIAQFVQNKGYNVVDCDKIYQNILLQKDYIEEIRSVFPSAVVDNAIDKNVLRKIVFGDKQKLLRLNEMAHKRVGAELSQIVANGENIFVEVSAFVGSGLENFFDKIICVVAKEEDRINRIMKRNSFDRKTVQSIIESQPLEEELKKLADFVVLNDTKENAEKEIEKILKTIFENKNANTAK